MLRLLPLLVLGACGLFSGPDDSGDTVDPNDPCEGVSWEGYCDGDVAVWCEDDQVQSFDCADEGMECGLTDDQGYFCVPPSGGQTTNPSETNIDGMLTTNVYNGTSSSQGDFSVPVQITEGSQSFLVTAQAEDAGVFIWRVRDPSGNVVLRSDRESDLALTGGLYWQSEDNQLNWPSRPQDGPLAVGEWTVDLATTTASGNSYAARDLEVTVQVKADTNLGEGQVKVAMIYAGTLGEDGAIVNAVEGAVDRWREVWQPYGLELFVTYFTASSVPETLPGLTSGSDHYEALSSSQRDHMRADIVMVIGERISGSSGTLGVAGGIPGTTVSTRRAATILSWLAHAGGNGTFDAAEISLMGETMAHEAGHYMGLFHVVEQDWSTFDPLTDTSTSCTSSSSCAGVLGDNLMFPTSVCDQNGCVGQDVLSSQQQGVKHRYIGTL